MRFKKHYSLYGPLLAGALVAISCNASTPKLQSLAEARQQLSAGLDRWQKAAHRDYFYWTTHHGPMGSQMHITAFQYSQDRPQARYYKTFERDQDGRIIRLRAWKEYDPGQRGNPDARPPRSMPELYQDCQRKILPLAKNIKEITLKIDQDGALRTCSYFPTGCQDDCGRGLVVAGILYKQITAVEEEAFLDQAFAEFMK